MARRHSCWTFDPVGRQRQGRRRAQRPVPGVRACQVERVELALPAPALPSAIEPCVGEKGCRFGCPGARDGVDGEPCLEVLRSPPERQAQLPGRDAAGRKPLAVEAHRDAIGAPEELSGEGCEPHILVAQTLAVDAPVDLGRLWLPGNAALDLERAAKPRPGRRQVGCGEIELEVETLGQSALGLQDVRAALQREIFQIEAAGPVGGATPAVERLTVEPAGQVLQADLGPGAVGRGSARDLGAEIELPRPVGPAQGGIEVGALQVELPRRLWRPVQPARQVEAARTRAQGEPVERNAFGVHPGLAMGLEGMVHEPAGEVRQPDVGPETVRAETALDAGGEIDASGPVRGPGRWIDRLAVHTGRPVQIWRPAEPSAGLGPCLSQVRDQAQVLHGAGGGQPGQLEVQRG